MLTAHSTLKFRKFAALGWFSAAFGAAAMAAFGRGVPALIAEWGSILFAAIGIYRLRKENDEISVREQRWLNDAIDVNIHEESPLSELLGDVCEEAYYFQKYVSKGTQSRSPEELLAFVRARLRKRLLRDEISFEREGERKLTSAEALALLNGSETWNAAPTSESNYLKAVHIWSYDHKKPLTVWFRYWIRSRFRRPKS